MNLSSAQGDASECTFAVENTPNDVFENAIRKYGVVSACEWFGHQSDSEFTQETIAELNERLNKRGES